MLGWPPKRLNLHLGLDRIWQLCSWYPDLQQEREQKTVGYSEVGDQITKLEEVQLGKQHK